MNITITMKNSSFSIYVLYFYSLSKSQWWINNRYGFVGCSIAQSLFILINYALWEEQLPDPYLCLLIMAFFHFKPHWFVFVYQDWLLLYCSLLYLGCYCTVHSYILAVIVLFPLISHINFIINITSTHLSSKIMN